MKYTVSNKNSDLPILIYIHGGPGVPDRFFLEYFKTINTDFANFNLDNYFQVFYVELYGGGKSFSWRKIVKNKINYDFQTQDIIDLAEKLYKKTGKKIYILGHSWGSIIGLNCVQKQPHLFEKYIGVGQIFDYVNMEKITFYRLKNIIKSTKNSIFRKIDIRFLQFCEKNMWKNNLSFQFANFGQNYLINKYLKPDLNSWDFMIALIKTQHYSLKEKIFYFAGVFWNWYYLNNISVSKNINFSKINAKIPMVFIYGENDLQTPKEQKFLIQGNPKVIFFTISKAGHFPFFDSPKECINIIK